MIFIINKFALSIVAYLIIGSNMCGKIYVT